MTDSTEHDLLGYLLDALDAAERQRLEERLEREPALHDALTRLRAALDVLDDGERHCPPPADLVQRTCELVFQTERRPTPPARQRARRLSPDAAGLSISVRSWRFVDLAVAVAICLAGIALVFPLINVSRANARVAACANKLRQLGVALAQYSDHHNGFFPRVEETGNLSAGGIYAPILLTGGYVNSPQMFVCPSSELAEDASFRVPTIDEVKASSGTALDNLRREMGGSYGYALGYRDNGVYKPTRNLYRETFALAADAPTTKCQISLNHGCSGHNVLLEDGHVVYLRDCRVLGSLDDIFVNDEGHVAAGCHQNDSVVARSDATP